MKIHRMKPENPIIIVDEEEFERIDSIAKLKEEEVEKLAEEKFLQYVKDSGIQMCLQINGVEKVLRRQVIDELNYNERGYPMSVQEKVKYAIVDDIKHYVNNHFEHYKDDCMEIVQNEWNRYKSRYENQIKHWKLVSIFALVMALVFSAILIYIIKLNITIN